MKFKDFTAEQNDDDRRIDKFVLRLLPSMNISLVCANLRSGFIRLNGKKTKNGTHIFCGDVISIEEHLFSRFESESSEKNSKAASEQKTRNDKNLDLEKITLFKNEHILIVNKPYGMLVQASGSLDISLDKIVRDNSPSSVSFRPGPMHRLDRNTTGLLCFSQSLKGARWFQDCMETHAIKKTYIALVEGTLKENQEWKDYLDTNFTRNKNGFYTGKVDQTKENDLAITEAEPIASENGITLVEFHIQTGRHHQIRLQSCYHGHPLLFDDAYGAKSKGKTTQAKTTDRSFFLHCCKLEFEKNELGIPEKIICPPDADFIQTTKKFLPNFDFTIYNNSL